MVGQFRKRHPSQASEAEVLRPPAPPSSKIAVETIELCLLEQLRPVLGSQRLNLLYERGLLLLVEFRRRRGPSRNGRSHLRKKFLLPGWRADTDQTGGVGRSVVKTMRGVGGNVYGVACFHDGFPTTKRRLHFSFQENKISSKSWRCGGGPPPGGMCISITQNLPAVSAPVTVMV